MDTNYEYRFELKPGKFVYLQTKEARQRALHIIKAVLRKYRPHPIFYHVGKSGGHISAMHLHENRKIFSRYDLDNFFGHVTRTKLTRSLCSIGFRRDTAFELAREAVVVEGNRKILPFGFRQSPLLATLVLEKSALGRFLIEQAANPFLKVSVYMDDILISADDAGLLEALSPALLRVAEISGFPIAPEKTEVAAENVKAFNCRLSERDIVILDERMAKFVQEHGLAGEKGQEAISRYISAVSPGELERFMALLP